MVSGSQAVLDDVICISAVTSSPQAVYQKVLQLAYVDKLLDQVLLAFRDRYKNELDVGALRSLNFGQEFEVGQLCACVCVCVCVRVCVCVCMCVCVL